MKSQILLGAGLCLLSYISQAQSKLIFNYDLAGNQIKYRYCKGADCDRQRASKTKDSITKKPETLDDFVVNRGTEFRVFPNPASHILYTDWYLKGNPKLTNVEVSDISEKH